MKNYFQRNTFYKDSWRIVMTSSENSNPIEDESSYYFALYVEFLTSEWKNVELCFSLREAFEFIDIDPKDLGFTIEQYGCNIEVGKYTIVVEVENFNIHVKFKDKFIDYVDTIEDAFNLIHKAGG